MNLAGIEISYLLRDLAAKNSGYYLSNVYGITRDCLLFKLRHPEKEELALMFSTFGLWLSSSKIAPIEENKLQRRLRMDLLRTRLENVKQLGTERIAYLTFEARDKKFVLVGEFFSKGNIILCNEEMKIQALLHSLDVRHRKLRVGAIYVPPPSQDMDMSKISADNLKSSMPPDLPAGKWLGRTLGLPSRYVEEIFRDSQVSPKSSCSDLSKNNLVSITDSAQKIIKCLRSKAPTGQSRHQVNLSRVRSGSAMMRLDLIFRSITDSFPYSKIRVVNRFIHILKYSIQSCLKTSNRHDILICMHSNWIHMSIGFFSYYDCIMLSIYNRFDDFLSRICD